MFFTPETLILQKTARAHLLTQRDPAMNAKLIKALEREIRALREKK